MSTEPTLPADFPKAPFEAVEKRISVDLGESHPDSRREFAGGWNALWYRYITFCEHDQGFTRSIQNEQTPLERYYQERDLFGFFVAGQSAIESLCYGLYAIASILRPDQFPIRTQKDLRAIKWNRTGQLYTSCFPGEGLTTGFDGLARSQEFTAWREQRNILAHRCTPGRVVNLGGSLDGITEWSDTELNRSTTSTRRHWLEMTIGDLLKEADQFTAKHLSANRAVPPGSDVTS